ncbi:MAG: isoprenyl transferase [Planctomycetota bacterium]|nr:isoprenyl transferase [Planctomycetota bacterium]
MAPYSDDVLAADGLDRARLPRHIAVIMDGNGRWAQSRGLPRVEGHRRGVKTVRWIVEECARIGLEQLTLYCFSHENWKRPPRELDFLMSLFEQFLIEERAEIMRQDIVFSMIGRRQGLSTGVLREVDKSIDLSRNNQGMRLCLAVNYGSRQELVDACRSLAADAAAGKLDSEKISEEDIASRLYTAGMPDPDLLLRTAGEMRISNFLLWQISYAELWVTQKAWPEFRKPDLIEALRDFAARDRRFGGLKG